MIFNKNIIISTLLFFIFAPLAAHDILLEFKGAAFVPTSQIFRQIYDSCAEFGIEATGGQLRKNLYAFTSIDFLIKSGETVALESPTKVTKVDFALGLKYFIPFSRGDVYFGLGVQPTRLFTNNQMTIQVQQSQWSCGGIAKVGVIFDLPRSFFTDIFIDYSFVDFNSSIGASDQFVKTAVNGCLFGCAFGYRFN